MYTITLKNGVVLAGLTMNGSMFVSQDEVIEDVLNPEALESVAIAEIDEDGNKRETVVHDVICDGILHWPEGWLFNLRVPTAEERRISELQARSDMLTECILEMSEIIYGE